MQSFCSRLYNHGFKTITSYRRNCKHFCKCQRNAKNVKKIAINCKKKFVTSECNRIIVLCLYHVLLINMCKLQALLAEWLLLEQFEYVDHIKIIVFQATVLYKASFAMTCFFFSIITLSLFIMFSAHKLIPMLLNITYLYS